MILFGGLLWGLVGTPAHAQQLLLNRSCESTTSGDVADWTELEGNWTCADKAPPIDGSLHFFMEEKNLSGEIRLKQEVGIKGGTTVFFSGSIRTKDESTDDLAGIRVKYLDGSGAVIDTFSTGGGRLVSDLIRTEGTWETKRDVREAPEGTETVRVVLIAQNGGSGSGSDINAYFDDLRLNGKVQITEVMQNPSDVSDSDGEYVELYNSTASDVSIDGWTLNGHSISSVTVPARGMAVLCRNSTAGQNGGVETCDDELSSLNLGDDSGTITLRDGSGITIDSIHYDAGSGWPNPSGESMVFTANDSTNTSGNWTSAPRRERGFRLDESGDLGSPGRNGTKQSTQPTANVASGSAGWQMLSAPVAGVNADTLAQANLVQGFSGHFPNDDVNLYQWPGGTESNNNWTKPSSPTADLTSKGTGYIWYVFGSTGTAKTDVPPFTVSVPGVVRTTDVTTASLSGTSTTNSAFHLLGNPYGQSYDLSGLNLGAQNFQTTVQVWDPSEGSYDSISQDDQSSNDLLAAYQGFFVERTTSDKATLTFSASGRTSSSASLKSNGEGPGRIAFRLTGQDAEGDTLTRDLALTLQARSGASVWWDPHDASKLTPLTGSYATMAFRGTRDSAAVRQAVLALPRTLPEESVEFPLVMDLQGAGSVETFTLAWPKLANLPEGWRVTLHDTATDSSVKLQSQSAYSFAVADTKQFGDASSQKHGGSIPSPRAPRSSRRSKSAPDTSRFALTIQSDAIPVELTHFGASVSARQATLEWTTASETSNAGFHVEHRGPEADAFTALGFVEGHGTTQRPHTYRYRTDPLDSGTHTFRLRQVDTDGTEHLSRTVDVDISLSAPYTATIQPHPVTTSSTLELVVRRRQEVRVTVYDLLGRRMATIVNRSFPANEPVHIPLRPRPLGLKSGTYFLRVKGDTFEATERLVVVR